MKKILFLALMAIVGLGVSAQTHKWYAGGQLTFGRTTESASGVKSTQVTVLPELGYNFNETFGVGTKVGVQYRKAGGEEKTVFLVDPYLRCNYYRYEKIRLFVDGGVDLGIGRADGSTAVQFGIGFRPGVALDINDKFSLVAHLGFLGYQGGNNAAKRNGAPENWGLNFDTENLMFGFSYSF